MPCGCRVGAMLHFTRGAHLPLMQRGHVRRLPPQSQATAPPFAASASSEVAQKRQRAASFGKALPLLRSSPGVAHALAGALLWPIPPDLYSPTSASCLLPAAYPLSDAVAAAYPRAGATSHHVPEQAHAAAQAGLSTSGVSKAAPLLLDVSMSSARDTGTGSSEESASVETVRVLQSLAFVGPLPSLPPFSGLRCFAGMHIAAPTSDALRLTTA